MQGRIKSMNESIYYCVDDLHRAIAENRQISFEYMKWNLQKSLVSKRSEPYIVSPWALTWGDENYYLIAYDEQANCLKHFRVDKMKSVCILQDKRIGRDLFKELDLAKYSKMNFDMFGGDETKVKLAFKDEMVGVMIDRFGRDIPIIPSSKNGWSETYVDVALSGHFFGWLFALGTHVKVAGPESVVEEMKGQLESVRVLY